MKILLMLNVLVMALLIVISNSEAGDQSVVMEIKGMTCELCGLAVRKSLSEVEGSRDVRVSLEEGRAWIIVKDTVTDHDLIDAVEKAGPYKGKVVSRE